VPRGLKDPLGHFRSAKSGDNLPSPQSDAFAEAVARMLREQNPNYLADAPSTLKKRSSVPLVAKLVVAVASAAVVALVYVVFFAPMPDGSDDRLASTLRSLQSAKSSSVPQSHPQHGISALVVRNHSGLVNDPLELGVSVETPDPGATVTIKGMPPGARLTAGVPLSFTEWRVPAEQVASAMVIPPTDFAGELNLSAELRSPDGAAQVASFMQLVWKAAPAATAIATSSVMGTSAAPNPPAPQPLPPQQLAQPQPPQAQVQPQPPQTIASLPTANVPAAPPAPRADAIRDLSSNEIASLIRRAQEQMAMGDVKAARALLLRAAEAHDARAALSLAKTFDPILLRQLSTSDPEPDLAQARNWYQRAREWGAPEAQRQLDALASYSR
jgi:hypothetical protein